MNQRRHPTGCISQDSKALQPSFTYVTDGEGSASQVFDRELSVTRLSFVSMIDLVADC